MKKILYITLFFVFSFLNNFFAYSANWDTSCTFDPKSWEIWTALNNCLWWTALVESNDASVDGGFSIIIQKWVDNISIMLWVFAVLAIVVWSMILVFSAWEDEKITKWKTTIKWWIIGFLAVLLASTIVNLIARIIYSI